MNIFKDYFNISTILSLLFGLAIIVLSFLSDRKPELDYINLLMGIVGLLAIINSYGDGISQLKNKRKIYHTIGPKIQHIISFPEEQFSSMALSANEIELSSKKNPTKEDIILIFSKLNPFDKSHDSDINTRYQLNWLQYLNQYNQKTLMAIMYIYQFTPFLEIEFINLLSELEECYYFKEVQLYSGSTVPGNKTLEFEALEFFRYQQFVKDIENYFNLHIKKYSKNTPAFAIHPA